VLWDRATGEPVRNAIVWQDRRTGERCAQLIADGAGPSVRAKTGLPIDPYFSATKLAWMLDSDALLRTRAETGELCFGTIDAWLIWKLSAGRRHATDPTNASRTLVFNIDTMDWDDELLGLLGVPRAVLPEVASSSGPIAETDPAGPLGRAAPIAGVAGDQQAALFGQACFETGQAKNTYGTGLFCLFNTGDQPVHTDSLIATVAWRLADAPPAYALEGAVFVGGATVQWLRDGLGLISNASETEALARSLNSNDGVYFVPALAGLGAPHWDPNARGTIVGLTRGTTRAHLARAALEAMGYQTRDVIDAMQRESGVSLPALRVDGGAVANKFLMQFQADMLGVPVIVPESAEATVRGAAGLAGLAVGLWTIDDLAARAQSEPMRTYEPAMSRDQADTLHAKWLDALERAKGWA